MSLNHLRSILLRSTVLMEDILSAVVEVDLEDLEGQGGRHRRQTAQALPGK
jgi:hypothetical protein